MKDLSKLIILPLGAVALVGACAPYPPYPGNEAQPSPVVTPKTPEQSVADEKQRKLEASRERMRREEARRKKERQNNTSSSPTTKPKPKPKYPTAASVPGKPGFVFNPYTHNIVDVKGIGSGKLVKDPEDSDPTHKFRVP